MKGLIIKDLIALKKQVKIFLVLAAFYVVFSIITKNTRITLTNMLHTIIKPLSLIKN